MNEWLLCIYRLNIDNSHMLTMENYNNNQPIFVIIYDFILNIRELRVTKSSLYPK